MKSIPWQNLSIVPTVERLSLNLLPNKGQYLLYLRIIPEAYVSISPTYITMALKLRL